MTVSETTVLESYRESLREAINGGRAFEFSMTPMDRLGLPLWTVALIPADGALCDGFGYGPSLEIAQTSAWGEAVEWYFARQALSRMPRVQASFNELQRQGRAVLDPLALCLSAGSGYTPDQPLTWVEGRRYPSGEAILVPIEAAAPRYADIGSDVDRASTVITPITNGLGAGPSFEHALAHGIMELIQRDGNSVNYRAMDRGVAVELDDVRDPETRALLAELDARGVDVIVKLAATDFGMANLYVVGVDRDVTQAPQPITLSACGEAAHPDRERALAKALREFVSSRSRKPFCHGPLAPVAAIAPPGYLDAFQLGALRSEDDRALQAMREWVALDHEQFYEQIRHPILDVRSRVRFSDLPTLEPDTTGNPKYLLDHIARQLAADNLEIIYVNFTPERTDVSALKAIVPGLEVETMTYQRVGRRNIERLLERSSPLVGIGSTPHGAKPIPLRVEDEERIGGPAWFDPAALDQTIGPLYALYREPGRHVIGFTSSSTDE